MISGNFTCLAVVFNLKRRLGYHLFHTYVPTTLIVVMSWISFWIRPEAIPARVTLGVTSLLTLATQNTQSQSSLPPVSYVKAIDVWMSSCTVFVFMSLMEFAVVNHYMGYTGSSKLMRGYSVDELDKLLLQRKNGVNFRGNSFSSPPRTPNTCTYFDNYAKFEAYDVKDIEPFHIHGTAYMAIANFRRSKNDYKVDSEILKYNLDSNWILHQKIRTYGAVDWEFFTLGSGISQEFFLAVANKDGVFNNLKWISSHSQNNDFPCESTGTRFLCNLSI
ncbi:glycine receptor subunit alphaZ1 [Trichonephila inaurata madagascariensis]|uniref:Glycine receptor subunit alphaZ1 n=1 Tax=Trichonephila inaurata madagascariensis TaxID=2747483 RepID=A0A8X6X6Z7_9ARAC|nr:glycine receptor subunit alphaZ1 [Trichonephila inaurata madagascariensis]